MPKFLEEKLKKKYGADSSIPYKIMNKLGFMHGSKETAKGKAAEEKHNKSYGPNPKVPGEMDKEKEVEAVKNRAFATEYLMGKSHHAHSDAKPVRTHDMVMSQEHKLKRTEVGQAHTTEGLLKGAIKWNTEHEKNHHTANIRAKRLLKDHMMGKMAGKFLNQKGY